MNILTTKFPAWAKQAINLWPIGEGTGGYPHAKANMKRRELRGGDVKNSWVAFTGKQFGSVEEMSTLLFLAIFLEFPTS
jgi:hypothetical protein